MSAEEYIIKQEGDVRVSVVLLEFGVEGLGRMWGEGVARDYQVGFLVLTNRNLYFVVTGFAEGLLARELSSVTPFGIGRRAITSKRLSLQDVYKNVKNPGSIVIPLRNIRFVKHRKPVLSGGEITIGYLTDGKFMVYVFMFPGLSRRDDWKQAVEEWTLRCGGRIDGAPPPSLPDICPECGSKMEWVPMAYRYYCLKCRQFK